MRDSDKSKNLAVRPLKNIDGGFLVWKELGETPLETLQRVREQEQLGDIKMTYAGRLDPAAEGELLVLVGEACKQKDDFLGRDKTYQFEVLFGLTTDTLDLLGIVNDKVSDDTLYDISYKNEVDISEKDIDQVIPGLVGKQDWPYPAYCSKTFEGQAMWEYARQDKYEELLKLGLVPKNDFEIYDISYKNKKTINGSELISHVQQLINKVSGDFRQSEIMASWEQSVKLERDYQILKFETRVSSGTYVRQIAEQFGKSLLQPTTTFSITRTKIHL